MGIASSQSPFKPNFLLHILTLFSSRLPALSGKKHLLNAFLYGLCSSAGLHTAPQLSQRLWGFKEIFNCYFGEVIPTYGL